MRYIIELNGEEPTVTIEEILDRELGRNCKCQYADFNGKYLDEFADKRCPKYEDYYDEETCILGEVMNYCYKKGFKDGYKAAIEGVEN